jgi:hypothetical protein
VTKRASRQPGMNRFVSMKARISSSSPISIREGYGKALCRALARVAAAADPLALIRAPAAAHRASPLAGALGARSPHCPNAGALAAISLHHFGDRTT